MSFGGGHQSTAFGSRAALGGARGVPFFQGGSVPSSPVQDASEKKVRKHKACQACKAGHLKCDHGMPSCARCTLKKITCVYTDLVPQTPPPTGRPYVFVDQNNFSSQTATSPSTYVDDQSPSETANSYPQFPGGFPASHSPSSGEYHFNQSFSGSSPLSATGFATLSMNPMDQAQGIALDSTAHSEYFVQQGPGVVYPPETMDYAAAGNYSMMRNPNQLGLPATNYGGGGARFGGFPSPQSGTSWPGHPVTQTFSTDPTLASAQMMQNGDGKGMVGTVAQNQGGARIAKRVSAPNGLHIGSNLAQIAGKTINSTNSPPNSPKMLHRRRTPSAQQGPASGGGGGSAPSSMTSSMASSGPLTSSTATTYSLPSSPAGGSSFYANSSAQAEETYSYDGSSATMYSGSSTASSYTNSPHSLSYFGQAPLQNDWEDPQQYQFMVQQQQMHAQGQQLHPGMGLPSHVPHTGFARPAHFNSAPSPTLPAHHHYPYQYHGQGPAQQAYPNPQHANFTPNQQLAPGSGSSAHVPMAPSGYSSHGQWNNSGRLPGNTAFQQGHGQDDAAFDPAYSPYGQYMGDGAMNTGGMAQMEYSDPSGLQGHGYMQSDQDGMDISGPSEVPVNSDGSMSASFTPRRNSSSPTMLNISRAVSPGRRSGSGTLSSPSLDPRRTSPGPGMALSQSASNVMTSGSSPTSPSVPTPTTLASPNISFESKPLSPVPRAHSPPGKSFVRGSSKIQQKDNELYETLQLVDAFVGLFEPRGPINLESSWTGADLRQCWHTLMKETDSKDECKVLLQELVKKLATSQGADYVSSLRRLVKLFEQSVVLLCGASSLNWYAVESHLVNQVDKILSCLSKDAVLNFDASEETAKECDRILDAIIYYAAFYRDRQQLDGASAFLMTAYQFMEKNLNKISKTALDRLHIWTMQILDSPLQDRSPFLSIMNRLGLNPGQTGMALVVVMQGNLLGNFLSLPRASRERLDQLWIQLEEFERLVQSCERTQRTRPFRHLRLAVVSALRVEIYSRYEQPAAQSDSYIKHLQEIAVMSPGIRLSLIQFIRSVAEHMGDNGELRGLSCAPMLLNVIEQTSPSQLSAAPKAQ